MKITEEIDRRKLISTEDFESEYLLRKPLLLEGGASDWRARSWSPEYFASTFGDTQVFVETKTIIDSEPGSDSSAGARIMRKKVGFKEFIDSVVGGEPDCGYMSVYPIMEQFPGLQSHVDFPRFGWSDSERWNEFFLGPANTLAPLHYDTMENLFCQIYGRKEFLIIGPEFREHCYPVNESWQDGYSKVDVNRVDYERFPLFKDARAARARLNPGDLLYVPSGWWHSVRALDVSISVNEWFMTPEFTKTYAEELADPEALGDYRYPITSDLKRSHD